MREIKFRAWDFKARKMREVITIAFASISGMNIEVQGLSGYHFLDDPRHITKEFKLMQFTGLKDKNRKEIYEGDIVKDIDNKTFMIEFREYPDSESYNRFYHLGWSCVPTDKMQDYELPLPDMVTKYKAEVIGNIYENKKLLGEVK